MGDASWLVGRMTTWYTNTGAAAVDLPRDALTRDIVMYLHKSYGCYHVAGRMVCEHASAAGPLRWARFLGVRRLLPAGADATAARGSRYGV